MFIRKLVCVSLKIVLILFFVMKSDAFAVKLKGSKLIVKVAQVTDYSFSHLSQAETNKILEMARKILKDKLRVDVEFLLSPGIKSETFISKISKKEIKDCMRHVDLLLDSKSFSRYIKNDLKNKLKLQLISWEDMMIYFPGKSFNTVDEVGDEITENYFKVIRRLETQKMINKSKIHHYLTGCICRAITKHKDVDVIITNIPVIPSIPQAEDVSILNGQGVSGIFCRGISIFPVYFFEKLSNDMKYKAIAYQISHLITRTLCMLPVVHEKKQSGCLLYAGGETKNYYQKYLNIVNAPGCEFEIMASRIGEGYYKTKDLIVSGDLLKAKDELKKVNTLLKEAKLQPVIKSYIRNYTDGLLFFEAWIGLKEGRRSEVEYALKELKEGSPYIDSVAWFYFGDEMMRNLTVGEIKFTEKILRQ